MIPKSFQSKQAADLHAGAQVGPSEETGAGPGDATTPGSRVDLRREMEAAAHVRNHQPDMALKVLMVVYGDLLAGFIKRLIPEPARTRAIYREVFLRAFHSIHKFRRSKHKTMWAWLCHITYESIFE